MPETNSAERPLERLRQGEKIEEQVVLPFRKSLDISIRSLRARLFRNMVTVLTLVLAVAFLAFTLLTNTIAQGLFETGDFELRKRLADAGFDVAAEGLVGAKERWLIILSLLVCTVGIVNAQLMAVTERFREIGTMKCLGALDGFVLRLFLIEASIQGAAGAVAGLVVGVFVSLLVGLVRFGFASIVNLPFTGLLSSLGISLGVGLFLSLLGVSYPAWVAARMQPVEAMRSEE
jgi:cell division protein FtsX